MWLDWVEGRTKIEPVRGFPPQGLPPSSGHQQSEEDYGFDPDDVPF
jgi:hypothetical protein